MAELDPYTQVLRALWEILEASSEFTSLVKPGNRVKFDGARSRQVKSQVATADLPEVMIFERNSIPHYVGSSNMTSDLVTFEVRVNTGDQRLTVDYFPLKWAILRVFERERASLEKLNTLTWADETFVRQCKPADTSAGSSEGDVARGIKGWVGVWAIDIGMCFTTANL